MKRPAKGLLKQYFLQYCISLSILLLIGGCSGNSPGTEDYGSIAISIKIVDNDGPEPDNETTKATTRALDWDYQVYVSVLDSGGKQIAKGGPWDWGDGQGTVSNIPVGSNRQIRVDVYDSYGSALLYSGNLNNVTITSGTNNLTGTPIYVDAVIDIISSCEDFSGTWNVTVIDDYSYCGYDYSDPYYGTYYISQSDCGVVIQFSIDGSTGTLYGYVEDDMLSLYDTTSADGSYTYTDWDFEKLTADTIDGYVDWVWNYGNGTCAGASVFYGTRNSGY
ncbi:MAG: hypothetical protein KJ737_01175 [Proteobacteria bacterium]|nr:hypothetical protein [Pseudomonadota bacterium]